MPDFNLTDAQQELRALRRRRDEAEAALFAGAVALRRLELEREALRSGNPDQVQELSAQIEHQRAALAGNQKIYRNASEAAYRGLGEAFAPVQFRPEQLIRHWKDDLPILLMPLRLETRFQHAANGSPELWVRIFPDEIQRMVHEKELTPEEKAAGLKFWTAFQLAADRKSKLDAYIDLVRTTGTGNRSMYVAEATKPAEDGNADAAELPEKNPGWSQAPYTTVLPDKFVVIGYVNGQKVLEVSGNPVPDKLTLGLDPKGLKNNIRHEPSSQSDINQLVFEGDIAWLVHFEEAVKVGMGLKIPLVEPYHDGFDRLIVIGLDFSDTPERSRDLIHELLQNHQFSSSGLSIVPQGTPTNNFEENQSGWTPGPGEIETAFVRAFEADTIRADYAAKGYAQNDADRLVQALDLPKSALDRSENALSTFDFAGAAFMNAALWPASLGYFFKMMMAEQLSDKDILNIYSFFTGFVTAGGPLPALRVRNQPYGVVLTSAISRWQWHQQETEREFDFFNKMTVLLRLLEKKWDALVPQVKTIESLRNSGNPDELRSGLLDIFGLHPGSVSISSRGGVGKNFSIASAAFFADASTAQSYGEALRGRATQQWAEFSAVARPDEPYPFITEVSFWQTPSAFTAPTVDTLPLSEKYGLNPDSERPDRNYIHWLRTADGATLMNEHFFRADNTPAPRLDTILYEMLRYALLAILEKGMYAAGSANGHFDLKVTSKENEFYNIRTSVKTAVSEQQAPTEYSKLALLNADASILFPATASPGMTFADYVIKHSAFIFPTGPSVTTVRDAMQHLEDLPTAQLERLFADHLDLCSYRLDAWQTGFFTKRMEFLRSRSPEMQREGGTYLGAYGWLENLKRTAPKSVVTDVPEPLAGPEPGPITEAPDSGGLIHAPSVAQAVSAAILRNGFISHSSSEAPDFLQINLSSARVRNAQFFFEGLRNGQSIGALLGYQFERALHDAHLDKYILAFRKKFPTGTRPDDILTAASGSRETIPANNVVDGFALLNAYLNKPDDVFAGIVPAPGLSDRQNLITVLDALANAMDAVADLAMAESVHQAVQGRRTGSGDILQGIAEGRVSTDPDVVKTTRSGAAITLRAAVFFDPTKPVPAAETPRASLEPQLNAWLGNCLGAWEKIGCWLNTTEIAMAPQFILLSTVYAEPIDLVYEAPDLLSGDSPLERRLKYAFRKANPGLNDQLLVFLREEPPLVNHQNLFTMMPLLAALRQVVLKASVLDAASFFLPSEKGKAGKVNPRGQQVAELKQRIQLLLTNFLKPNLVKTTKAFELLSLFNFPEAIGALDADAGDVLLDKAKKTLAEVQAKLDAFLPVPDEKNAGTDIEALQQLVKTLFGESFRALPRFKTPNAAELQGALDRSDDMLSGNTFPDKKNLHRHWLQGLARVRPQMAALQRLSMFSEMQTGNPFGFLPAQLPNLPGKPWFAAEYKPEEKLDRDYVSFLLCNATGSPNIPNELSGLLFDEWTELIPAERETTGVALNYDQPNAEAPQAMLLAVAPELRGNWDWDDLLAILNETLDRAKRRAVDPDIIAGTSLAQFLPALLTLAANPDTGISPRFSEMYNKASADFIANMTFTKL